MKTKDITTFRGVLDFLQEEGEVLSAEGEIDPILEVTGVVKALDSGPALLFDKIKGYPDCRVASSIFSNGDRINKIYGVSNHKELKQKGVDAFNNPIRSVVVESGPCQEVVITEDIDVLKFLPILQYTETDPGRILGGGVSFLSGDDIGTCVSYKRMHFRGKDWSTLAFIPGSHMEHWVLNRRMQNRNLPFTVNICAPPSVMAVAGGGALPWAMPAGCDELGIAGGLQGAPVRTCKAKTVDALSLADAEFVIEGYLDTTCKVWESEEAENDKGSFAPFFPEFSGHEGKAIPTYKFQVTAITHRKQRPILEAPLAHSVELPNIMRFINFGVLQQMLDRTSPGLVTDVNALDGMKSCLGLVIQVKKRRRRDDGVVTNLILATMAMVVPLRMVIVVDEDVDIYNADEVMWAFCTRVDAAHDILTIPQAYQSGGDAAETVGPMSPVARMGIDATAPKSDQAYYYRGKFPEVDLSKWFSEAEISHAQSRQSDYAKLLAKKRV